MKTVKINSVMYCGLWSFTNQPLTVLCSKNDQPSNLGPRINFISSAENGCLADVISSLLANVILPEK